MTTDVAPATDESSTETSTEVATSDSAAKKLGPLHTEHGDTLIADQVVQKIAGMACREVPGIFAMGNAAGRMISNIASRIPGSQTNVSGGVSIEKGERQTTIDVSVVVDYGVSIVEVSESLRTNVIEAVEYATGLQVLEVNVHVTDVHLPDEDSDGTTASSSNSSTRLE